MVQAGEEGGKVWRGDHSPANIATVSLANTGRIVVLHPGGLG